MKRILFLLFSYQILLENSNNKKRTSDKLALAKCTFCTWLPGWSKPVINRDKQ